MNKKLKANLEALKESQPALVPWIENAEPADWYQETKTPTGQAQLLITTPEGRKVLSYKEDSPAKDAKQAAKTQKRKAGDGTVVSGLGLGYGLAALNGSSDKKHFFLLVETDPYLIRQTLSHCDISKRINSGHVLFGGPNRDTIAAVIGVLENRTVFNWFGWLEPYVRYRPDYFELHGYVQNLISQTASNTGTLSSAGARIAVNDIETMPRVINRPGVVQLAGFYEGKPAVTIGTGPSLLRNIMFLQQYQGKVVIIAVAQALRILKAFDIKPDFICTVDFGDINREHMVGLMDEQVPMVALNRAYSPTIKEYQGPMFFSANPSPPGSASELLNCKGAVLQGGSVAHMCMGLAVHMGCSPIIMIGQDLALSGERSHNPLSDAGGKVRVEEGQIKWEVTDPGSSLKEGEHGMGQAVYVPGYWSADGQVLTNAGLKSFITSFEQIARSIPIPIINCTEGGAKIEGTKQMMLKDALEEYAVEKLPPIEIDEFKPEDIDKEELIKRLEEEELATLEAVKEHCQCGLDENKIMSDLEQLGQWPSDNSSDSKELVDAAKANKYHSEEASKEAAKVPALAMHIYGASRLIRHRDMNVKNSSRRNYRIRLDRNQLILETTYKACVEMIQVYEDTINDLLTGVTYPIDPMPEKPDLSKAEEYLEQGNWANVLVTARKIINHPDSTEGEKAEAAVYENHCLAERAKVYLEADRWYKEMNPKGTEGRKHHYLDLLYRAQELGKQDKYVEALELLTDAFEISDYPETGQEALWGLASNYRRLGKYDEARKYYEQLVRDFPNEPRYPFELALLKIHSNEDVLEGLVEVEGLIQINDSLAGFLLNLAGLYQEFELHKEALDAVKRYIAKFPGVPESYRLKADILDQLGETALAKKARKRAKQLAG